MKLRYCDYAVTLARIRVLATRTGERTKIPPAPQKRDLWGLDFEKIYSLEIGQITSRKLCFLKIIFRYTTAFPDPYEATDSSTQLSSMQHSPQLGCWTSEKSIFSVKKSRIRSNVDQILNHLVLLRTHINILTHVPALIARILRYHENIENTSANSKT